MWKTKGDLATIRQDDIISNAKKAESEDMAKAEAAVVELLNSIKHMSEDIEKKEDAA